MLTARRYRLELTPEQVTYAERVGNACRDVWNTALEQRRIYRQRGAWMNYVPQAREMAEAKAAFPWLAEVPGHCLQQTLMDLDKACRAHGTFGVHWRSKARWSPSFRFPEGSKIPIERLNRGHARIRLPKLGWVKFRWSRPIGGVIRSATVSQQAGHWYISFLIEDGEIPPDKHAHPGSAVGVDRGVVKAVARSDGAFHDRKFATPGELEHRRRLQQRLARAKRGSGGRKKTVRLFAKASRVPADRRMDFCAQTAHELTRDYALVVLEDLKTTNMTKVVAPKPDSDRPGAFLRNGAAAKSGLNRAILDKGWYALELALRSKSRYTGTEVKKIPAAYTSQRCSRCGHVDANSRESQAKFQCTACKHSEHADVNAAKNILAAGLAVTACGDLGVGRSVKQEPAPPQGSARRLATVGIPRL